MVYGRVERLGIPESVYITKNIVRLSKSDSDGLVFIFSVESKQKEGLFFIVVVANKSRNKANIFFY
jgi:hypothetical protein